jgi:toxin ParE1/3/4
MQPLEIVYRPAAVADLKEIARYVLQRSGSRSVAENYLRRIRQRCRDVGLFPEGGTPRDDLAPGLRTVAFERRAVIAYVVEGDKVVITNVIFGGRDFEALYRGQDPGSE